MWSRAVTTGKFLRIWKMPTGERTPPGAHTFYNPPHHTTPHHPSTSPTQPNPTNPPTPATHDNQHTWCGWRHPPAQDNHHHPSHSPTQDNPHHVCKPPSRYDWNDRICRGAGDGCAGDDGWSGGVELEGRCGCVGKWGGSNCAGYTGGRGYILAMPFRHWRVNLRSSRRVAGQRAPRVANGALPPPPHACKASKRRSGIKETERQSAAASVSPAHRQ